MTKLTDGPDYNDDYIYEISNDAGRSLMGSHQENWFYRSLSKSSTRGATWRVIGNQIVFSRVNISSWFGTLENPYNGDQWDVSVTARSTEAYEVQLTNTGLHGKSQPNAKTSVRQQDWQ